MSDTYKTDPYWVKIWHPRTSKEVVERHDHRNGVCDLPFLDPKKPFWWQNRWRQYNCGYDASYYGYHGGFYPRPPHGKEYRKLYEGRMRAGWRKQKHDLLKLDREGIEDYDVKTYQHRHSALWELY